MTTWHVCRSYQYTEFEVVLMHGCMEDPCMLLTNCVCHYQEAAAIDDVYFPPGSTVTATYDQVNKCFGKQKFIRVDFSKVLEILAPIRLQFADHVYSILDISILFTFPSNCAPFFLERQEFLHAYTQDHDKECETCISTTTEYTW